MEKHSGKPAPKDGVPAEPDSQRDRGFQEIAAEQGLKKPPFIDPGEDSGEWTRGGGSDPHSTSKPGTTHED